MVRSLYSLIAFKCIIFLFFWLAADVWLTLLKQKITEMERFPIELEIIAENNNPYYNKKLACQFHSNDYKFDDCQFTIKSELSKGIAVQLTLKVDKYIQEIINTDLAGAMINWDEPVLFRDRFWQMVGALHEIIRKDINERK